MIKIASADEIKKVSELSVKLGNIPFFPDQAIISILEDDEGIGGFAAVQSAWHAAGSWVKEEHRRHAWSYQLRNALDNELRRRGIKVYFALPGNEFERTLFAKYGHVTEQSVQVRHL